MRTTVNIDDELLIAAKKRAQQRGVALGTILDEALRRADEAGRPPKDLPALPVFKGSGLQPGVDLSSNRAIAELLDSETSLRDLR